MTLVYLVRHAEVVRKFGDPGLNQRGRAQAHAVGAYLAGLPVAHIYTSPLKRSAQTARIIAKILKAPLSQDIRLRERANWGDVMDQSWEEFAVEWDLGDVDPDYIPKGGVSARQAAGRMSEFMLEKVSETPGSGFVAVTHGGILNDFLLENIPVDDLVKLNPAWKVHGSELIRHASITTLRWDSSGPVLEGLAAVVK